jgi:hypothetical protein
LLRGGAHRASAVAAAKKREKPPRVSRVRAALPLAHREAEERLVARHRRGHGGGRRATRSSSGGSGCLLRAFVWRRRREMRHAARV